MKQVTIFTLLALFALSLSCVGCGNKTEAGVATKDSTLTGVKCDDVSPCTLTVAMVGDVMMGTTFPDSIHGSHLPKNSGRNLFDECSEIIKRADVASLNLEGSFLDNGGQRRKMTNPNTYYIFRMPTGYVSNLKDAGFDFVGIANNHINDFGNVGRQTTMSTIKKSQLGVAGLTGLCETAYFSKKGLIIGFTQFGHSDNNLDVNNIDELKRVVLEMRSRADIVIVSFHGGAEGRDKIHVPKNTEWFVGEKRGNVYEFAHKAIDFGADVVVGHGPHVPRAIELYKGHLILYSLGNFCTPYRISIAGVSGYAPLAEIKIDEAGKFISGTIHSYTQRHGAGPHLDKNNNAAKLIRTLTKKDFPTTPLVITDDGKISIKRN